MTEAERHKAQADIVFQMRLTEAMAPLRAQLAAYKAALEAWIAAEDYAGSEIEEQHRLFGEARRLTREAGI